MPIYTPVNDFSAKDNLATGDPEKIILGSDMDAETAAIQTAITTAAATAIPEGTDMLFYQAAAPTGWVKSTSDNDKALRVTSGDGGGTGGSVAFETAFASQTPAGTISVANTTVTIPSATGSTSITEAQMPAHYHFVVNESTVSNDTVSSSKYVASESTAGGDTEYDLGDTSSAANAGRSSTTGSGDGHTHTIGAATEHNHTATFSGTAIDLDVQYLNVIVCAKSAY
jgi:hypothetical protein